jgi:hypothetical protein
MKKPTKWTHKTAKPSRAQIQRLRGKYHGKRFLKALMAEKKLEREL